MASKVVSNCQREAKHLYRKLGGKLVYVPTKREYKWPKVSHAYWESEDGEWRIEFLPLVCKDNDSPDALGNYPMPYFPGYYELTKLKTGRGNND